jgi:hypothetical protein
MKPLATRCRENAELMKRGHYLALMLHPPLMDARPPQIRHYCRGLHF